MAKRTRKEEHRPPRKRWMLWSIAVGITLALGAGFGFAKRSEAVRTDPEAVQSVSFSDLSSFPYTPPARGKDLRPDPFPREVRALDGKRVSIAGYMVPLHFQDGKIESFYLSRGGFACCYADAPKVTDYIKVSMPPGQFAQMSDLARVSGVLEVGEELGSGGWVETVYRLKAEAVKPAEREPNLGPAEYFVSGLAALGVLILAASFAINVLKPWLRARHIGLRR